MRLLSPLHKRRCCSLYPKTWWRSTLTKKTCGLGRTFSFICTSVVTSCRQIFLGQNCQPIWFKNECQNWIGHGECQQWKVCQWWLTKFNSLLHSLWVLGYFTFLPLKQRTYQAYKCTRFKEEIINKRFKKKFHSLENWEN